VGRKQFGYNITLGPILCVFITQIITIRESRMFQHDKAFSCIDEYKIHTHRGSSENVVGDKDIQCMNLKAVKVVVQQCITSNSMQQSPS
jgi:hypothetical protein